MKKERETHTRGPILPSKTLPEELKITPHHEEAYLHEHDIRVERLTGGAVLIAVNQPADDRQFSSVDCTLRVGSYDDPQELMGITHLGEHMVFNGCSQVQTPVEQQRQFLYGGYGINAQTRDFDTIFTLQSTSGLASSEYGFEPGIDNLFSMMFNPALEPDTLEYEKSLILDEYWRMFSSLSWQMTRAISETAFDKDHIFQKIITGTEESLSRISYNDLVSHLEKYFVPANTYIGLMSTGDEALFEQQISVLKGKWDENIEEAGTRPENPDFAQLAQYHQLHASGAIVKHVPYNRNRVMVSTAAIYDAEYYSKDAFALGMAVDVLNNDVFTLLRRGGYGYAPLISSHNVPYLGTTIVQIGIEVDKSRYEGLAARLPALLSDNIRAAMADDLASRKVISEHARSADSPYSRSTRLYNVSNGIRQWGQVLRSEDVENMRLSVEPADINSWLERFVEDPGALFLVGDIE